MKRAKLLDCRIVSFTFYITKMGISNRQLDFDDVEIDSLESLRRHGHSKDAILEEIGYYTLAPSRTDMMNDWREWRTQINDVMTDLIGKVSTGQRTLTAETRMKTPEFFKGTMSIHGKRVKDQYGGQAINVQDSKEVRKEKKIMDENFFLFGIPRISLHKETCKANSNFLRKNSPDQQSVDTLCKTSISPSILSRNKISCKMNLVTSLEMYHPMQNSYCRTQSQIPSSIDSNSRSSKQSSEFDETDEHVYCEINSVLLR